MSATEREWWAGPHGEAFDRALNGLLDEDDAADVIALVQESFVPRAIHQEAVSDATTLARELHRFRCNPDAEYPCAVCRELWSRLGITTVGGQ
jgi:hypothetical protein